MGGVWAFFNRVGYVWAMCGRFLREYFTVWALCGRCVGDIAVLPTLSATHQPGGHMEKTEISAETASSQNTRSMVYKGHREIWTRAVP